MWKNKKGAIVPFAIIITLIFVLLVIGMGLITVDDAEATDRFNQSIEFAKNETQEVKEETLEFCPGENRRSTEPVTVSMVNRDFSADGAIKCANIEDMRVSCNVPGTHERDSGCLLDSFERTQWVEDGCEGPVAIEYCGVIPCGYIPRFNRGWYKFNFSDPDLNNEFYGKNKKFIYPCGGTIKKKDSDQVCVFWFFCVDCHKDWLHRVNSGEKQQKYKIGLKLEPNEEILVNSYFCDLWATDDIGGSDCSGANIIEKCEAQPSTSWGYCDGKSYNMEDGNFSVKAYVCCPPSGVVKGPGGNIVYDSAGNDIIENWYWDSEEQSCCLGRTCINKECEDAGGVWMYGRCWFRGGLGESCKDVCENRQYSDGTDFQCKMPNWSRVPRNNSEYGCTLHEILGVPCSTCRPLWDWLAFKPPEFGGTTCWYYNGDVYPIIDWCSGNAFVGRRRLCACV
jgi:hypothetical protein